MATVAFRMRVHAGCETEYRRRHDALWPELARVLRERGIEDYRIFLDGETRALFAVLRCPDPAVLDGLERPDDGSRIRDEGSRPPKRPQHAGRDEEHH
jgi:L-rhamnose mutarotase